MDILDRLGTVWPADYALQPITAEEILNVIQIQELKVDAFQEIFKLRQQLADAPSKTEIETKLVIDIEKLLCEKLNIQWAASGISVENLINRLAEQPQEVAQYIDNLESHVMHTQNFIASIRASCPNINPLSFNKNYEAGQSALASKPIWLALNYRTKDEVKADTANLLTHALSTPKAKL